MSVVSFGTNMLLNGSFELPPGDGPLPEAWDRQPNPRAMYSRDPLTKDGRFSLKIEMRDVADPESDFAAVRQYVPGLLPERLYIASVDYQYTPAPDGNASARTAGTVVYCFDSAGQHIPDGTFTSWGWPPIQTWRRKVLVFRPPVGTAGCQIEFRLSTNGALWIDLAHIEGPQGDA